MESPPGWRITALPFRARSDEAKRIELSPQRLGGQAGAWACVDFWKGELLYVGDEQLTIDVPAKTSRLLSCWPLAGRPQFVGSNRHITQGADDVESVAWNESQCRLSGVSRVVAGDPYKVRIFVPDGFKAKGENIFTKGNLAELSISSPTSKKLRWQVTFKTQESGCGQEKRGRL